MSLECRKSWLVEADFTMSKQFSCIALAVTMGVLCGGMVIAHTMTPREQIEARQSNFKDLGGAFKTVRDQLRLSRPDFISIEQAAQTVKEMSHEHANWFPNGTGQEAGFKTAAKPEIWSDPQGFAIANNRFAEEGAKLYALAQAKDLDGLKAHALVVGQACKACHDKYRVPQD
jgi:cytochrome c556